jgi:hypothetical protein
MTVANEPGFPTIQLQISFGSNPTVAPSWTDVSDYVRGWSLKRGRQHELDQVQAGTLSVRLDNRDRRFDPTNVSGPYYGDLKVARKVQLSATFGSATYILYTGFIERYILTTPGLFDGLMEIQCSDGWKMVAGAILDATVSYSQELSGSRINNILDTISWTTGQAWVLGDPTNGVLGHTTALAPVGDRAIDTGSTTIQAFTGSNTTKAIQHLGDVVNAEFGVAFVKADGTFCFQGRQTLYSNRNVQAVFGGGAGQIPYRGKTPPTFQLDDQYIYNRATATIANDGSSTQYAYQDPSGTSIQEYFLRSHDDSALILVDISGVGNEVNNRLQHIVNVYQEPQLRVPTLEFQGGIDDPLWPAVLAREIGDVVTVYRTPQSAPGLAPIVTTNRVEGIQIDETPWNWRITLSLSLLDTQTYWVLGTSALTSTTRLAY